MTKIKLGKTKLRHEKSQIPVKLTFKESKKENSKNHLTFSFEALDFSNEYFNLDGTCTNWTMTCCKERDRELEELQKAVIKAQEESQEWQQLLQSTYEK